MGERLAVCFPGGKRVDVQIREFSIPTDQSPKAGGAASAPEPFDLFLASLAACAGIYALNFCQSRQLSTVGLGLAMDWERDPAQSLKARVCYRLRLPKDFPEKYRRGICKAIELCTVKKMIQNAPEFSVAIED